MQSAARNTMMAATLAGLLATGGCTDDAPLKPPPSVPDVLAHCSFEQPPEVGTGEVSQPGPVRAAVAFRVLPMPIGAPLGGYGERFISLGGEPFDARAQRFSTSFVPSIGMHDAPTAAALAIEAGGGRALIVRVDVPLLNENTLFELEQVVAPDGSMRGRILLTASHSHGAWAGWQPSLVLMPGIDRPRRDLADRILNAMAEAAKEALANLEPARLGVAVATDFDPDDTLSSDRRTQNDDLLGPDGNSAGQDKDPFVWGLRVDRADGSPLAALFDMPIHGTVGGGNNPLVTTDVSGAIERALSAQLGYPVLHLQGAAGDVAPQAGAGRTACPDSGRCLDMPALEALGARTAQLAAPLISGIDTGDTAVLEMVTRTFYNGRDATVERPDGSELAYAPFMPDTEPDGVIFEPGGAIASPIDEFNTIAGAGLCGQFNGGSLSGIPGTFGVGAYSSCLEISRGKNIVFSLFEVDAADMPVPLCDTVRTTASALRLGGTPSGDYLILSVPGEATAPFAAYLRSRSPAAPERTLLVGYAGDHVGYLMTAEDWLAGGYEPSINIWGPLEGEIIIDGIVEAAELAWTPEREDPEVGSSRFLDWVYPDTGEVVPIVTSDHGQPAAAAIPLWPDTDEPLSGALTAQVPRAVGAARFAWWGGDPAVDMPEVIIERKVAEPDVFEPLTDALGHAASSRRGVVVLSYRPEPLEAEQPAQHLYAAVFQPLPPDPFAVAEPGAPFSLPLGEYRFRVLGNAQGPAGVESYELLSDPFEVIAAPLSTDSTASKTSDAIAIIAQLAPAPGMRALLDGVSDVGVPLAGPWTVLVKLSGAGDSSHTVMPDASGQGTLPLNATELADAIAVDVRDAWGNGAELPLP